MPEDKNTQNIPKLDDTILTAVENAGWDISDVEPAGSYDSKPFNVTISLNTQYCNEYPVEINFDGSSLDFINQAMSQMSYPADLSGEVRDVIASNQGRTMDLFEMKNMIEEYQEIEESFDSLHSELVEAQGKELSSDLDNMRETAGVTERESMSVSDIQREGQLNISPEAVNAINDSKNFRNEISIFNDGTFAVNFADSNNILRFDGTDKGLRDALTNEMNRISEPGYIQSVIDKGSPLSREELINNNLERYSHIEDLRDKLDTNIQNREAENKAINMSPEVIGTINNAKDIDNNILTRPDGTFGIVQNDSVITFNGTDEGLRDAVSAEIDRISDSSYIDSVVTSPSYRQSVREGGGTPLTHEQFETITNERISELITLRDSLDNAIESRDLHNDLESFKQQHSAEKAEKAQPVKATKSHSDPSL